MKKLLLLVLVLCSTHLFAQSSEGQHRLVFQVSSGDTLVHKMVMRQLRNLQDAAPGTQVEVLCFGPGLDMLVSDRTVTQGKIAEFKTKGIVFLACENTMKDRNVDRSQLIPEAATVKAAIIHLMERQEQGWSYLKGGF